MVWMWFSKIDVETTTIVIVVEPLEHKSETLLEKKKKSKKLGVWLKW
jgi:hypothetical protein